MRLHIYVDAASVEVFGGQGECVITDQIFPAADSRMVSLFAVAGDVTVAHLDVTPKPKDGPVSGRSFEKGALQLNPPTPDRDLFTQGHGNVPKDLPTCFVNS